jgi:transcription elongation factor/antiterminator RfaH
LLTELSEKNIMQSWYLLYCKRGQLQRAQEHLQRQAVNCLTPMISLEKMVRGKRTTVSEPLFPNYLFVEFDPEVIHTTTINATAALATLSVLARARHRFLQRLSISFPCINPRALPTLKRRTPAIA